MNEPEAPQPPPDPPPTTPEPPAETPPFIATLQGVWERIKHHKVVQWTLAYLAVAYTLLHGAEMLTGSLGWPHGWVRLFTLLLILGVPIVITLAWYHGSRGQQRASGTEIMIIALLLALGGAFLWRDTSDHQQATHTQTASEAPAAVLIGASVAPNDKSIAVLPFADMSPANDQEFMADGIAEELLNRLAKASELKVIARTSSFAFKGQSIDIAEIARKLNVAHVLEGSVRKSGNRLRITAQLIRAADSTHLWSETFDRALDDIFAVQDEIATEIMKALQVRLIDGTLDRREGGTKNREAFELYLRAEYGEDWHSRESLDAVEEYINQAIRLDPEYGLAWSTLSSVNTIRAELGYLNAKEAFARAREFTRRALEVAPDCARAHAELQDILFGHDWNFAAAEVEAQRALALLPTDPIVLNNAGRLSTALGRLEDARRKFRAALARDPLNGYLIYNLASTYYLERRFDEAEALARRLFEVSPEFPWTRVLLGQTLVLQGKLDEALSTVQGDGNEGMRLVTLPIVLRAAGKHAEADEALRKQIEYWEEKSASFIVLSYAHRRDYDLAFKWLERAYEQRDPSLLEVLGDPLFGGFLDDPRYKAFRQRMNLPELPEAA